MVVVHTNVYDKELYQGICGTGTGKKDAKNGRSPYHSLFLVQNGLDRHTPDSTDMAVAKL